MRIWIGDPALYSNRFSACTVRKVATNEAARDGSTAGDLRRGCGVRRRGLSLQAEACPRPVHNASC